MNYYYCETCEVKLNEKELGEHATYCYNFSRITLEDYEDNEQVIEE